MKIKCIKESSFANFVKDKIYETKKGGINPQLECLYHNSDFLVIAENGKIKPEFQEYFEVVEEKDFEWYLKETLAKLKIETGILAFNSVDDWIDMFQRNTSSLITRRFLISETYRTIAEELNNGWAPDWNDNDQEKWYNYYDYAKECIGNNMMVIFKDCGVIYFHSKETAEKAAEIMGNYLKEI